MATQSVCGTLVLYPAFQEAGELRLSSSILTEIARRRLAGDVPLAFLFAECDDPPPDRAVRLGRYSRRHQVWEYDPELGGSPELVPKNRRVLA
jgi:hypothetical protein